MLRSGLALLVLISSMGVAQARSEADCQSAWSRAVRSYLTTNRRAAPDGSVPEDLDGEELAVQAWLQAFSPACRLEAEGQKAEARVEAATIGVRILARLDPQGCKMFLGSYMECSRPADVCSAAGKGNVDLRDQVARTIPPR